MSRLVEYCNITTDLQNVCKQIELYAYQNIENDFFAEVSGEDYSVQGQTGFIGALYINRIAQTVATSLATISASTPWYYDATLDQLYLLTTLVDSDITILSDSWENVKKEAREKASGELESFLYQFNRPLPFKRGSDQEYDEDIITACAMLTCRNIIRANDIDDMTAKGLHDKVYSEDEGLLYGYMKGERAFSFEATKSSLNGLITPVSVSGTGTLEVAGVNDSLDYYKYEIEITTGGAIGTAKYLLTKNNVAIGTKNTYLNYVNLHGCVYMKLSGTFQVGDKWIIEFDGRIKNTNETGFGSIRIKR